MLKHLFNSLSNFIKEPFGNYCALVTMSSLPFMLSTGPDELVSIDSLCYVSAATGIIIKSAVSSLLLSSLAVYQPPKP